MRTIGPGAARGGTLVAIMAIGAFHQARSRPRRDQAGNILIFAGGFNGMKRLIAQTELKALVRLRQLPVYPRRAACDAVAMAAEAQFVLLAGGLHHGAAGIYAGNVGRRLGEPGLRLVAWLATVGIVAVGARDVAGGGIDDVFIGQVRRAVLRDGMNAGFLEIGCHIFHATDAAIMAGKTVLFRRREFQQALLAAREM